MPEQPARSQLRARFGARSEAGRVRNHNEDRFFARPPLFMVADGMGGHQAGEVAAAMAVDLVQTALENRASATSDDVAAAVRIANRGIHDAAAARRELAGMGTTCTVALIGPDAVHLAHVGDSRAYLFRDGRLEQLTSDHTLVGELVRGGAITEDDAREHHRRHVVTRALGIDAAVEVDSLTIDYAEGDRLVLCSDGLSGELGDDTIAELLREEVDADLAAERLTQLAIEAGGRDNVTVVVLDPGPDLAVPVPAVDVSEPAPARRSRGGRARRLAIVLGAVLLLLLALAAGMVAMPLLLPPAPSPSPSLSAPPSPSSAPSAAPSVAPSVAPSLRPSARPSVGPASPPTALGATSRR